MKKQVFLTSIDAALENEINRIHENSYRVVENGISNLPRAIKILSASVKGERYASHHNLKTQELELMIAKQLGVSEKDLLTHRNDPISFASNIYHLDLPTRTFNALNRYKKRTIESVLKLTYNDAMDMRSLGDGSIQNLVITLNKWAESTGINIDLHPLIQTTQNQNVQPPKQKSVMTATMESSLREEIKTIKKHRYHETSNPKGIDNLPHAIKIISQSSKGQRYVTHNHLTTHDLELMIAKQLNVSETALLEHRNDPITLQSNVYHLNISTRTFNALQRAGRNTIDRALELTYDEAMDGIRNLGNDSIQDLILSLKDWSRNVSIPIDNRPLIQTTPDPSLQFIGPKEVVPHLNKSFDVILATKEYVSVDVLAVSQSIITALKKNKVYSLKVLAKKPISTWTTLTGIGTGSVLPLILAMEDYEHRMLNTKTYIADINIQASISLKGINKEEVYEQAIEQLRQLIDKDAINISINEKEPT